MNALLENLEKLDVESKAWTVSLEPSDGNLQAPLEYLEAHLEKLKAPEKYIQAKKNMLNFLHFLHLAQRHLGVKSVESAACFCKLYARVRETHPPAPSL